MGQQAVHPFDQPLVQIAYRAAGTRDRGRWAPVYRLRGAANRHFDDKGIRVQRVAYHVAKPQLGPEAE